ncbi:MAG: 50S ribosomal protein L25 [Leptospiraceae bacterium]|nr:50S ribosomal protein L25 [Leptospiraceae bacterium]
MNAITLSATNREQTGKNAAGRLRAAGSIPANLIGGGEAQKIQILTSDFERLLAGGLRQSQIIALQKDGQDTQVIVKEIQREPVKGDVQHIDFIKVHPGKKTLLKIAIESRGVARGVKMGGALEHFIRVLKIKAIPESFKDSIVVDISHLDIDQAIRLQDLDLPESWEILLEGNPIVMKVAPGRMQRAAGQAGDSGES